jgi:hypothetical protein
MGMVLLFPEVADFRTRVLPGDGDRRDVSEMFGQHPAGCIPQLKNAVV